MAISGRSLQDAARKFTDHINGVLCKTLTQSRLQVTSVKGASCVNIGFRQPGELEAARFNSDYGWLSLSLAQNCDSIVDTRGDHELRTMAYWYYLYGGDGKSLVRWEYKRHYPTREDWAQNQGKKEKDWVEPKYYRGSWSQVSAPGE
jgi:hypothetical protein